VIISPAFERPPSGVECALESGCPGTPCGRRRADDPVHRSGPRRGRFGVLTLAWMIIGYFSLFDLAWDER